MKKLTEKETSWAGGETEIINRRVTVFGVNETIPTREFPLGEADPKISFKEERKGISSRRGKMGEDPGLCP